MIIENGTVEFKDKTDAAGIDPETGYPQKAEVVPTWGAPIRCQYYANTYNRLGLSNGERIVTAKYTILIEERPLKDVEQVRIKDCDGDVIGEYSIIQVEPLPAVGEIRIFV